MPRIYLDHNATTPLVPPALERFTALAASTWGNASSVHHFGQQAKAVLDDARAAVAGLIGAEPSEVIFTAGGTESDNAAIRGAAEALEASGRRHLVVSSIEHEAVLQTVKALAKRGWDVTLLPVGQRGVVEPGALAAALTDRTAVVSVMHANNEIGTIQPIAALAALARARGALFHTDAVQTAGKLPIDVQALGVDLLSLSAHKFGGPKGTGALWVRRGVRLAAFVTGGRQERNRRAGTENVPAIGGMGAAAQYAQQGAADAAPRDLGVDAERVDDGHRLAAAEVAAVDMCHQVAHVRSVPVGGERYAHAGVVHRLGELGTHVLGAVAAGDASVDANDVAQVGRRHGANVGGVARQALEVVVGRGAETDLAAGTVAHRDDDNRFRAGDDAEPDLVAGPVAHRQCDRVVALGQVGAAAHCAVDEVVWCQPEAHAVQPSQHRGVVPRRLRVQVADGVATGPLREGVEQPRAHAVPARVGPNADQLEPQTASAAAEFALEHARENVAGEAARIDRRELRMQRGIAQCGSQAPFDIGPARSALDGSVDGDNRREVVGCQCAHREMLRRNGFHPRFSEV